MTSRHDPEVRFVLSWIPLADVKAAAEAAGMSDDEPGSFWDFTSQEEHERQESFLTFADAVTRARAVLSLDVFGIVQIIRQRSSVESDERGSWVQWNNEATWDVSGDEPVDEARPDQLELAA